MYNPHPEKGPISINPVLDEPLSPHIDNSEYQREGSSNNGNHLVTQTLNPCCHIGYQREGSSITFMDQREFALIPGHICPETTRPRSMYVACADPFGPGR